MRRLLWLVTFAAAMAYLEAAVVVYLRTIYYPRGFAFPLVIIPNDAALVEIGREGATLVMILGVAALAAANRREAFLLFALVFGVWDILYYAWLRVLAGWPPSLLTPDILFLIPVPWVGPVLAPIVVSLGLIAGSLLLLRRQARWVVVRFHPPLWAVAIAGGVLVLLSFTIDFKAVLEGGGPPPFRWGLFGAGVALGVLSLATGLHRLKGMIPPEPGD